MSITATIINSFNRSFKLYNGLLDSIDNHTLESKLPGLPSNTVGQQLWCVVGARESFSRAIAANQWSGFACSLEKDEVGDVTAVSHALHRSEKAILTALQTIESYSDTQNQLIIDLLEHETAHHGQLIRYLYGLKLTIPDSWKGKYALG